MKSVDHGGVLTHTLGHPGGKAVPQLVVNIKLARRADSKEGIIDSIRLSYALTDAVRRGHIGLLLGSARGHLTIPYKLIHVLVEGQVLLAMCVSGLLAKEKSHGRIIKDLIESLRVGILGDTVPLGTGTAFPL